MAENSKRVIIGALLFILIAGAGLKALSMAWFAYSPLHPGSQDSAFIEVQKGQSAREVTKALVAAKVIEDASDFLWTGRILRQWGKIKAGEYKVTPAMSPIEIFSVLTSGISVVHPVTIREGENMYEIAADLEAKKLVSRDRFLKLCRETQVFAANLPAPTPTSLEGYLFPDTYHFNRAMSPEEMIRQMLKRFQSAWTEKEEARARELGLTPHEAITLASMIEKETGAPQERPLISSVFHNRLKKRMRLQSDPTTIYGIWERYTGNITRADLLAANPYNTYQVPALPAGPIGNPGKESIQAALFPATSDYLFFVSHNDGTHEFTRNLNEHNNAVRKFQLDRAARDGKSWRNLNKKSQ